MSETFNILILDDKEDHNEQLKMLLEEKDFQKELKDNLSTELSITTKSNFEQAKNSISENDYDLIISDLRLDEINLPAFWEENTPKLLEFAIKDKSVKPFVDFILISAFFDDETINKLSRKFKCISFCDKGEKQYTSRIQAEVIKSIYFKQKRDGLLKYLDRRLWVELYHNPEALEAEKKEVLILFADIRGYTKLCEKIRNPQFLTEKLLNPYFEEAEQIIHDASGILDKTMGDGLMAVFIESRGEDMPKKVMAVANNLVKALIRKKDSLLADQNAIKNMAIEIKKMISELALGCGISSDTVYFGSIGTGPRRHLTAIGNAVNMAQRLESAAKKDNLSKNFNLNGKPNPVGIIIVTNKAYEEQIGYVNAIASNEPKHPSDLPYHVFAKIKGRESVYVKIISIEDLKQ